MISQLAAGAAGATAIALSLASATRPSTACANFTSAPLLSVLIAFGIQGVSCRRVADGEALPPA